MAAAPLLLAACSTPVVPRPSPSAPAPSAQPRMAPVVPVEAEPTAPATQPAINFIAATSGPVAAALAYADKVRPLGQPELASEINRLGEPGEVPLTQMQLALALAQTRVPADLARAQGLMQRVASSTVSEAQQLAPLARTLAARYGEQRRLEEEREKQAQQLRESQRRIDQLSDRLEALRAIERSFTRPSNHPPAPSAPPPANGAKP
ncbi:hypothetical protein ACIPRI_10125 [Variovorax sp. LARHSF232]